VRDPSDAKKLGPDFEINTGPDGTSWIATSHAGVSVYRLNEEKTGPLDGVHFDLPGTTLAEIQANVPSTLSGGIGISYNNGWWYLTGSNRCGNCIAGKFYYLMARHPLGPWMSPATGSTAPPLQPALLSEDTGKGQVHGSVMLPDASGTVHTLIPVTHYVSSPTGAPTTSPAQPGDNNLALSGHFYYPLTYDAQGRILPMKVQPSHTFPLARALVTTVPTPYQANLGITRDRSVVQSWEVRAGEPLAAVLPSVFQRTPDMSPKRAAVIQEPLVNAPLLAKLELPDGRAYHWSVDPRTIAWAPARIALNLPEVFNGSGRVTLTLTTSATNGGYGVAIGKKSGRLATVLPHAEMLLRTSAARAEAPRITAQPKGLKVRAGSTIGLLVEAQGVGLGYQWFRNGQVLLAPDGLNESTTAGLRLQNVTAVDAGVYTVQVMNQAGSVTSIPVTVEVTP
jgi:hypothetical protein